MPGRSYTSQSYRYGFNGQENDNEISGTGNTQNHSFRSYDTRLGRYKSIDPLTSDYPWYTPYQFAGNSPIMNIDLEGLEPHPAIYAKNEAPVLSGVMFGLREMYNDAKQFWGTDAWKADTWKNGAEFIADMASPGVNTTKMMVYSKAAESIKAMPDMGSHDIAKASTKLLTGAALGVLGDKGLSKLGAVSKISKVGKIAPSPNVQKTLSMFNDIKAKGDVTPNDLAPNQELNFTFKLGNDKLDLRIEEHVVPKKFGGNGETPQRHMNVDLYPKKSSSLPNKGHKVLDEE